MTEPLTTRLMSAPQSPQSPRTSEPTGQRSWVDERKAKPWEFALAGGGNNDEKFNVGNGAINATVGYYFNDMIELSARQSVSYSEDEGPTAGDDWNFSTLIALDLHFPFGCFVPYVGANVGYFYGDSKGPDDTFAAGPEAGAKIYLQPDAFLQIGAQWEFFSDREETLASSFEDVFVDGQILYFVGLGLRF